MLNFIEIRDRLCKSLNLLRHRAYSLCDDELQSLLNDIRFYIYKNEKNDNLSKGVNENEKKIF